jgi:hypothetical protein
MAQLPRKFTQPQGKEMLYCYLTCCRYTTTRNNRLEESSVLILKQFIFKF